MLANSDICKVQVWSISLKSGESIRAATIQQQPRKPTPCEGCSAPCCRGKLAPVLDADEFLSRKFSFKYVEPPYWLKKEVPRAQKLVVLDVSPESGCPYHDPKTGKCTIWPNCPKSCLSYDCREDMRPEIKEMVKERFGV